MAFSGEVLEGGRPDISDMVAAVARDQGAWDLKL
jgi:hypothetical protein